MLRNFTTVAFRNIVRHKGYSALNILGLAVGLACAFFIVIWMQDEVSTDQFHEDGDRIYNVMRHSTFGGNRFTTGSIPKPLAETLVTDYPEVDNTVLISWDMPMMLTSGNDIFRNNGRWAGADFFKVFSFPLLAGDASNALVVPESITLSEDMAVRIFGTDWQSRNDVLGSVITVDNRVDLNLTGVFANPPANSSLQFDFIIPIGEYIRRNDWVESWSNNGLRMVARLHEGSDVVAFNAKIKDVIDAHVDAYESDAFLYPFEEAYLRSDFENGVLVGGRIDYVRMFGLVALLIMVIASINFMNLETARSAKRAREIGVRKTVGASRASLATQFLAEAVLKAMLAFVVASVVVFALFPAFASVTGKTLTFGAIEPTTWLLFAAMALITGLISGSYPAMYLSSFSVTGVFDKRTAASGRGSGLRKGLVVVQFAMSIVLIVGTVTVYRQLEYIRTKDLGIDRENVAMVRLEGGVRDQYETFKQQALQIDGVVAMSSSNNNPLSIGNDTIGVEWEGKDPDNNTLFWNDAVGYDFVETMGITMSEGRSFSKEFGADTLNYVINWKAAEAMGMDDPVGQEIRFWEQPGTIVGVMEDFHMGSMYRPITPVIYRLRPDDTGILWMRIAENRTAEALAAFTSLYNTFNPEYKLNVRFLDDAFEESYQTEVVMGSLANVFAFVAIFIACLGLFGLASYTAEQRTKEIGIRKVLGASVPHVVGLLSRDYLLLVGIAFMFAAPISWFVMNNWLQEFEFHTTLGAGIMITAGVATLVIAWLTVSYQSIRSAIANPADSLRAD